MTEQLVEGFNYDLWANRRWLEYLDAQTGDDLWVAYDHMVSATELWLRRAKGTSPTTFTQLPRTVETLETLHEAWLEVVYANRHDPAMTFRRLNGEENSLAFSQVVRHVLNHGTYHRGELRGICRNLNLTDFPETDLLLYFNRP